MNSMLSEILFDASYLFIITGCFIALVFGLGLAIFPAATLRLNARINHRVSARKATKSIETPIHSEKFFYRYAILSGLVLVLGSAFVLYTLATFPLAQLIPHLPKTLNYATWDWLLQAAKIFFLVTCLFIFFFGMVVLIRPSQLKNLEQNANRWVSTRQHLQQMSHDIDHANKLLQSYPRLLGSIFSIVALVLIILLLPAVKG